MEKEVSSRKRVTVACTRCRAGKYKCDGAKPMCSTCSAARQPVACTYEISSKKRGLREGYVRGMEILWGIALRKMDGLEELLLSVLSDNQNPLLQPDDNLNSGPLRVWRKSCVSRALNKQLNILEESRDSSAKRKRYVAFLDTDEDGDEVQEEQKEKGKGKGVEGVYPVEDIIMEPPNDVQEEQKEKGGGGEGIYHVEDLIMEPSSMFLPEQDHDINSQLGPSGLQTSGESSSLQMVPVSSGDDYQLPSYLGRLVDVYFSYTHCWFPILEKHHIRRLVYRHLRNNSEDTGENFATGKEDDISAVILWAIAALSTHQVSQSELWCINCGLPSSASELAWLYYKKTRSMIPAEEDEASFEVVHVQALLIIAILNIGHGNWSTSWLLVGKAIHIAINLGLDDPCRPAPTMEDRRSVHVFWGCFVLDTLISAMIGRMPRLRKEDIEGIDLLCEEGDEEWDSWLDCLQVYTAQKVDPGLPVFILSTFNRLVETCKILNICCVSRHRRPIPLTSGLHLIQRLAKWNDEQRFPFKVDAKSIESASTTYLHHYNLQLVYLLSLDIIKDSVQQNHTKEDGIIKTNEPGGVLLEDLGLLRLNLLKQQSRQHNILLVPATYALIFQRLFQHPEVAVTNDMTNCFLDIIKVWPGVGKAPDYRGGKASGMHPMNADPRPNNSNAYSLAPPDLLGVDHSNLASYRAIQQKPQRGSNEGVIGSDNSVSLSEMDLHSTFDELVSMDANYWLVLRAVQTYVYMPLI
ncbi:Quinic acid utilization activator [Talaromyces pinophilus]|nr:Quinic acid utilization activator [Talaromyces pinophilus]